MMSVSNMGAMVTVMIIMQNMVNTCWLRLMVMIHVYDAMMTVMVSTMMSIVMMAATMVMQIAMMDMMIHVNWHMVMNWLCNKVFIMVR